MKKVIFGIIAITSVFATKDAMADCYPNYMYNWQKVTYCDWNSNANWYYYDGNYYYQYDWYYPYNYYYNNSPYRTDEENYYNMLYLNKLWWPWETVEKPDYFENNIDNKEVELAKIDAISLDKFTFKYEVHRIKYENSVQFIESLKSSLKERYLDWRVTYYRLYELLNDMENLVFKMNEEFKNRKSYDTTWNTFYKDLYLENEADVKSKYENLKFAIKRSIYQ